MSAWHNRELLAGLIRRDIQARFRGTVLGIFWAAVGPLVRLGAYTLIFGFIIQPKWQDQLSDPFLITFTYFAGLLFFDFYVECIASAANLMRENITFIKKIVFPVEILPLVVIGYATFRFFVGIALLLLCYLVFKGLPAAGFLMIPVFFLPLLWMSLGFMWMVSALATYVRDIGHVVGAFLPIFMFVSPIFFPASALPASVRPLLFINPLTFPIEQMRMVLFGNAFHDWIGLVLYVGVSIAVATAGHHFFMRLRPGFADVI